MRSFVIKCAALCFLVLPGIFVIPTAATLHAESFTPLPEPILPPWNDPNPRPEVMNESFSHPDSAQRWLPTETGAVHIVSIDPPEFELLPDGKVSRLGVMLEDDSPADNQNFAIGLQWDYSRPALRALREVEPGFPKSEKLVNSWPWSDQMVMDLGRPALSTVLHGVSSRMKVSGQMNSAFVSLALSSILPSLKEDKTGNFERAVLQLSLFSGAELKEAMRDTSIAEPTAKALSAKASKLQTLLAANLDALRPTMPNDLNETGTWAKAERAIVGEMGIAAIRGLQILAVTEPALAPKIAWLVSEIRHRTARELVDRYQQVSEIAKDFTFSKDAPSDMLAIAVCGKELSGMLESLETRASELARSKDEVLRDKARQMTKAVLLLRNRGTDKLSQPSVQVERTLAEFTAGEIDDVSVALLKRTKGSRAEHLSALASGREQEARIAAKYRWLAAMIEARETDVQHGYDPATDQNRLNDGRLFDLQHGIRNRGAGVELSRSADPLPVKLKAGRTYELSYRFKADNLSLSKNHIDRHRLSHQVSWLELIPLDVDGLPVFGALKSPDANELTSGKYLPFAFARTNKPDLVSGKTHLRSEGKDGWEVVRILIAGVPRKVAGCSFRIVVNNLLGQGSVLYDDIKLIELSDSFRESFENTLQGRNVPNWRRKVDNARGFSPYYGAEIDSEIAAQGKRSMRFQPSGFNVAYETARSFPLLADHEYIFEGALRTSHMAEMSAHFEILLFDEQDNPLDASGYASNKNVLRTPARGNSAGHIGWPRFATHEGWFNETVDLSRLIDAPARERGKRTPVTHVRIRLVIEGDRPNHSATIWMDALRLVEIPKVRASVGLPTDGRKQARDGRLRIARAEEHGLPSVDLSISGLPQSQAGWIFRTELKDLSGNTLQRTSNIGTRTPDKIIRTDSHGRLTSPDLPSISISQHGKPVYGVFDLQIYLRHPNNDIPELNRVIRITSLAPSNRRGGAVAVSEFDNQRQKEFLGTAFRPQWLAGAVSGENELDVVRTMSFFPGTKVFGIFTPNIDASAKSDALRFSNIEDGRWQEQLGDAIVRWRDTVHVWQLGPNLDAGWEQTGSNPVESLDAATAVLAASNAGWARISLPIDLSTDTSVLRKRFRRRWVEALDEDANISAALSANEIRQLKQLKTPPIVLRETELLNLVIPASMAAIDARASAQRLLQASTLYKNPLGEEPATIGENAAALLSTTKTDLPPPFFSTTIELGDYQSTAQKWFLMKELRPLLIQPQGSLFDEQGEPTANLPVWRTLSQTLGNALPFSELTSLTRIVKHSIYELPDASITIAVHGDAQSKFTMPVGHSARIYDLFGNRTGESPNKWGEITLPASRSPYFIAGVDKKLLETIASIVGNNTVRAEIMFQDLSLAVDNKFGSEIDISAEIIDLQKMADILRIAPVGSNRPVRVEKLVLDGKKIPTNRSTEFSFRIRPMLGWSIGSATVPVRFTLLAEELRYRFTHNVPIQVVSDVTIDSARLGNTKNGMRTLTLGISSTRGMRGSVRINGIVGLRRKRAAIAPNTANLVQFVVSSNALSDGQKLRFTIQEDGGLAFATLDRTVKMDAEGRLLLAED